VRLLHLADLHLGWQPSGWPAQRAAERRRRRDGVLERAVDVALAEGAHLVIVAGDLFDTFDPDPECVEAALGQLRRLEDRGVLVLTVPGNHDEITYGASVYRRQRDGWPGLLVAEPAPAHLATVELAGETVHLYGMAYSGGAAVGGRPVRDFPRLEQPGVHIAAFHGVLGVAAGGVRTLSLDEEGLAAARYHYVAMGSLHDPLQHRFPAGPAVYPGSPEAMGFGDGGCGAVTLAGWTGEGMQVQRVAVPVQPVRDAQLDLTPVDDIAEVDAFIAERADPDAVQRVRLGGTLWLPDLDAAALEERHAEDFFHLEVRDEIDGLAPELLQRWAQEASVRGAFVARMLERAEVAGEGGRERLARSVRWGIAALGDGPPPGGERRPPGPERPLDGGSAGGPA
jgi:DNA repair exonuclease SbcCD nuclease subunit